MCRLKDCAGSLHGGLGASLPKQDLNVRQYQKLYQTCRLGWGLTVLLVLINDRKTSLPRVGRAVEEVHTLDLGDCGFLITLEPECV